MSGVTSFVYPLRSLNKFSALLVPKEACRIRESREQRNQGCRHSRLDRYAGCQHQDSFDLLKSSSDLEAVGLITCRTLTSSSADPTFVDGFVVEITGGNVPWMLMRATILTNNGR